MKLPRRLVAAISVSVTILFITACDTVAVASISPVKTPSPISSVPSALLSQTRTACPITVVTSATPTDAINTPETTGPYIPDDDMPDISTVGLSEEEYDNIMLLFCGALNMYDLFSYPNSIKASSLLDFVAQLLQDKPDYFGFDPFMEFSGEKVIRIIESGLAIQYQPKEGDKTNDILNNTAIIYRNGKFHFDIDLGTDESYPYIYKITRISEDQLKFDMNMAQIGDDYSLYQGKATIVIQKDTASLFGYHIISIQHGKENKLRFTSVSASSYLPKSKGRTFTPENIIDGKDKTAWATENGINEWIMVSSDKVQSITGISFKSGDWTNDHSMETSGQPYLVRLDFSDGTHIENYCTPGNGSFGLEECRAFNRIIKTSYVKITILEIDPDRPNRKIYISEVDFY